MLSTKMLVMRAKYIIVFRYEDNIYQGLSHVSYVKCESLRVVEAEIERLRDKYEIEWLRVFPMSSILSKYSIGRQ